VRDTLDIEVRRETDNKLFSRKELYLMVSYKGKTPSRDEVKEEVCKKLSLSPNNAVVIRINQKYGNGQSEVFMHYYSAKDVMEKLVRKKKAQKAAAGSAAAPKPEAPKKEEKKEEGEKK
jgi:ribosomal protein S24E